MCVCSCNPIVKASFVDKTIYFQLSCLCFFCQRSVIYICVGLFLGCLFCFIDLCVSSFTVHFTSCFDYYSLIVNLVISNVSLSALSFYIVLVMQDLLLFCINFRISLSRSIYKTALWDFDWDNVESKVGKDWHFNIESSDAGMCVFFLFWTQYSKMS